MDACTIKLTAYAVIAPVFENLRLNAVETAAFRYLREGRTKAYIAEKLGLDTGLIIAGLADKGIINDDCTPRYKDADEWRAFAKQTYKKGYLFYSAPQDKLYDALVFAEELRFQDAALINYLGDAFVPTGALDHVRVIKSFDVTYNEQAADKNENVRKISEIEP